MICPRCALINTPDAERCDCGYNFLSGSAPENAALRPVSLIRVLSELIAAGVAGLLVIALPVAFDPALPQHQAAFMPFIGNAVEELKPVSLILLFVLGGFLGWFGRAPVVLTGPATVAAFPAWSVVDMAMGGGHTLLPFEWFLYGAYSVIGLAGATLTRFFRRERRTLE